MKVELEISGKTAAAAAVITVGAALALASTMLTPGGVSPVSPESFVQAMLAEQDHVQPLELAQWILEKRSDYQLIDLREPWEFDDYHIPGAINIPLSQLFTAEGLKRLDRSKRTVVYGLGSGHAAQAQLLLSMKGYRAFSLKEGVSAWWDQVMTPQSLRSANPEPQGYRQLKALRERLTGGSTQAPSGVPAAAPAAAPPPPTPPGKAPKKLNLGRGCS